MHSVHTDTNQKSDRKKTRILILAAISFLGVTEDHRS